MATRQIGKLKFNISKRGIAYKWGDGEIHRFAFQRPHEEPQDDYDERYSADGDYENEEYEDQEDMPAGFLYENDWVMYLALVLLPPLGIYILWKKNAFERTTRLIISAAAAIWFIILLFLLFPVRSNDTKVNKTNTVTSVTAAPTTIYTVGPVITIAPTSKPTATPEPEPTMLADPSLIDTDGTATEGTTPEAEDTYVYYTISGEHYHKTATCSGMADASRGTIAIAQGMGKTACPTCIGTVEGEVKSDAIYYATSGGTYFHSKSTCSGMKNATRISRADAEARGQIPCPTCVGYYATSGGKYYHCTSDCSGMKNATIITKAVAESQKKTACPVCLGNTSDTTVYYHTSTGKYYHVDKGCSGMTGATKVSLTSALAKGQTACPKCIGNNGSTAAYYATTKGKYYHTNKTCSGMSGATQVTKAAAEASGKTACPTCIGAASNNGTTVYFTKGGTYYHTKSTCSGMSGAVSGTIEQAKKYNKKPCPECVGTSGSKVYCTSGGTYYHVVSDCSGMKNASFVSIETAKKAGKTACPTCINASQSSITAPASSKTQSATAAGAALTSFGEVVEVYCTEGGTYYHKNATCSGMSGAHGTTVARAVKAGKTPCPTCVGATSSSAGSSTASTNNAVAYYTKPGIYYHSKSSCSGMSGATKGTVSKAVAAGKSACPVCVGSSDTKVYLTKNGTYYHSKSNCSGMSGASFVVLKVAINLGKTACPKCIGSDSALTGDNSKAPTPETKVDTSTVDTASGFTVYCTKAGTYYHANKSCSGMSGATAVSLLSAAQAGKYPCPKCVNASSENVVFATSGGKYYHTNKSCSGMTNATTITVAIAKANGKTACPTCAGGTISGTPSTKPSSTSTANRVYITTNGSYYHKNSTCSGMTNAKATTKDRAVSVYGKTECPVCYQSANTNPQSSTFETLTAVYCTKYGTYYHLKANCSGMTDAIATSAAAAKAAGKTACPKCINTDSSTRVYTSVSSPYYHNHSVCHGTTYEIATTYTNAINAGKTGCPYCTGKSTGGSGSTGGKTSDTLPDTADDTHPKVYATSSSTYYHASSTCKQEDLTGAKFVDLEKVKSLGKTACPVCMIEL